MPYEMLLTLVRRVTCKVLGHKLESWGPRPGMTVAVRCQRCPMVAGKWEA